MKKAESLQQLLDQSYAPQGGYGMFVQMLTLGNSQEAIGRYFGVSVKTSHNWVQRYRLENAN